MSHTAVLVEDPVPPQAHAIQKLEPSPPSPSKGVSFAVLNALAPSTCGVCMQDIAVEDLFTCPFSRCKMNTFHLDCVKALAFKSELKPSQLCPRHFCSVCRKEGRGLKHCTMCAVSYHKRCIPPSASFSEGRQLCRNHSKRVPRPLTDVPEWFKSSFDDDWKAEMILPIPVGQICQWSSRKKFLLPPELLPKRVIRKSKKQTAVKPPSFRMIRKSIYRCASRPKKWRVGDDPGCCECSKVCDGECINRAMMVECFGSPPRHVDPKKEKRCRGNCSLGESCRNRRIQRGEVPKTKVFFTGSRGWGLKAMEDVAADTLVSEYIGEVIDEKTCYERLEFYSTNGITNLYVMELENCIYIDAYAKGNISRFINHSCDPNCELQKWDVEGETRIGIFAIKHIPAGTEFSYDYRFFSKQTFPCSCGSANCRGTLGTTPKGTRMGEDWIDAQPSSEEEVDVPKRSKNLRKRKRQPVVKRKTTPTARKAVKKETEKSLWNMTSAFLPGTTRKIRDGVPLADVPLAREGRVFLLRNARLGMHFEQRKGMWQERLKKMREK